MPPKQHHLKQRVKLAQSGFPPVLAPGGNRYLIRNMQTIPLTPTIVPSHDNFVMIAGQPFCEEEYLEMNPDVRAHVEAAGSFRSGREHFELQGLAEGRLGVAPNGLAAERFFGERSVEVESLGALRAEKFPYAGPYPWLDREDYAREIARKRAGGLISDSEAEVCENWARDGYIIIRNCIKPALLDQVWEDYEDSIRAGIVRLDPTNPEKASADDPWPARYLDPHLKVPAICNIMRGEEILRWIRLLMGREPAPFQTITSHKGSQQPEHSDTIHMTTYPLGYLSAAWVAFEDISPDSGPLVYYPGSHRLPYVFSKDVGISEGEYGRQGFKVYRERYEPWIKRMLDEHGFKPGYFLAGKGDVLIWHANLIHGGSRRNHVALSRKALVCHYFAKGAVTYSDLSGSKTRPHLGTCLVRTQPPEGEAEASGATLGAPRKSGMM
jgi:hypothetical protein